MKVRYRFRFYPSNEQKNILINVFGTCRFVYNWALRLRTDAYINGTPINYNISSHELTKLKHTSGFEWMSNISSVPQQQTLRHLQTAFKNFFEKRAGYPKFKKKRGKQSAEYTRSAFKWSGFTRQLKISGLGKLKIKWTRQFNSIPTTVTITKDTVNRYFVTLTLDEIIKPLPKTKQVIGIDLGIKRLITLSNGERISNPRHINRLERKLACAQRILSRRKKGSNRWEKQRLRVAKIQANITDSRQDNLHKITTDLIKRFDQIVIEDLHVRGMLKNHKLAKHIQDASFGTFRSMLEYKCDWYRKELVICDRYFPSSKRCSACGYIKENLPLHIREWNCPKCNTHHDRDENAAINILGAGLALSARRGKVRRVRALA